MTRSEASARLARFGEQPVPQCSQLWNVPDDLDGVLPSLFEPSLVPSGCPQPGGMEGVALSGSAKPELGGVEALGLPARTLQDAAELDGGVVDRRDHLLDVAPV